MRPIEVIRCDGCGNKISPDVKVWQWEGVVPGQVVETHPNNRCASAAEKTLGVTLR